MYFLLAGISSLGAQFAKTRLGLKHLNLSKTSLSPKGVCMCVFFSHFIKSPQIVGFFKPAVIIPGQRFHFCALWSLDVFLLVKPVIEWPPVLLQHNVF